MNYVGLFENDFVKLMAEPIDIVATSDHPYMSPPIHVLDAHLKLLKIQADKSTVIRILNWDISLPNERTYRYDLVIDMGLAAKNRNTYLYDEIQEYVKLSPKLEMIVFHRKVNEAILQKLKFDNIITQNRYEEMGMRMAQVFDNCYQITQSATPSNFTKHVLSRLYALLNLDDEAQFISKSYQSFWESQFRKIWIPYCLRNAPTDYNVWKFVDSEEVEVENIFLQ